MRHPTEVGPRIDPMSDPDILYYDGSCPLCRREMAHLAQLKSDQLILQDIHALSQANDIPSQSALLKNLHLRRGDAWITGLDANIAAWQYTRIGVLWRWLSWPVINPIATWCYRQWAQRRFAKRYADSAILDGE